MGTPRAVFQYEEKVPDDSALLNSRDSGTHNTSAQLCTKKVGILSGRTNPSSLKKKIVSSPLLRIANRSRSSGRWPVGSFGSRSIFDSGTAHPIPTYPFPPVHIPIACTRFPVQLDRNCLRYVACIERSILCFYPATEDYDFS
ncbi:hypothetical protein EVAR_77239_1 [Eumeta japonica]|uniref:Uncharacterized protein n=1 Tax=Eumeta variegata TaxID=151549 RepID=A0A4C1ZVF4_EUMVA|nr:hypothetical protein EVAR_77239_1 [Eumeta japonica]